MLTQEDYIEFALELMVYKSKLQQKDYCNINVKKRIEFDIEKITEFLNKTMLAQSTNLLS